MLHQALTEFIAIPTIAHDRAANQAGIDYLRQYLEPIGFTVRIVGDSPFQQPVVLAEYRSTTSTNKVVLYGHYDVERIHDAEAWDTPPFQVTVQDGRYYGRGVADNKGILLARILAVRALVQGGGQLPNILWVLQGEEEVAGPTLGTVLPAILNAYGAPLYLEETGVRQDGTPVLFHLPQTETPPHFLHPLNQHLFNGQARLANRSLRKFTPCPFLNSLPAGAQYIGFGPNDKHCNIHRPNESMDIQTLEEHQHDFMRFLEWVGLEGLVGLGEFDL